MCIKYLPFNFFEDDATQHFFQKLNDNVIPKRDSIRTKVMRKFEKLQECLKQILIKNESKISLTIDGWTSVANKSFYGITAHFVDSNWELYTVSSFRFYPF